MCFVGGRDAKYMQLVYCNYYGAAELNSGGDYTLEASIEVLGAPTPGPIRVTFSGQSQATVPNGTSLFVSDRILPSSFGFATFPAGLVFFIKDSVLGVVSVAYPRSSTWSPIGTAGFEQAYLSGAASSQVMTAGVLTQPSGGSVTSTLTPLVAIVGEFIGAEISLFMIGDSIAKGSADNLGSGFDRAGGGIFTRPTYDVNGRAVPWTKAAHPGIQAYDYFAQSFVKRRDLLRYCTHAVVCFGTNDLQAGRTAATTLTALQTGWASLKSGGISRVEQLLVLPRVTSSDSYATIANQSPIAGFAAGGERDILNTAIGANVGSNGLDATINVLAVAQDGVATDKWVVTGAANYATADGVHPSSAIIALATPTISTRYATYGGGGESGLSIPTQAEASALIARMGSTPDATRQALINLLIYRLKQSGAWDLCDGYWVMAAHNTSGDDLLNWKSSSFTLTVNGSVTRTQDRGAAGDGSTGYLSTGYTPGSGQYAQNNAHASAFSLSNGANSAAVGSANSRLRINVSSGGGAIATINAGAGVSLNTYTIGPPTQVMGIRRSSGSHFGYRQGLETNSISTASTGLPDGIEILRTAGVTYGSCQLAIVSVGAALSAEQARKKFFAEDSFLRSIGAIAP